MMLSILQGSALMSWVLLEKKVQQHVEAHHAKASMLPPGA